MMYIKLHKIIDNNIIYNFNKLFLNNKNLVNNNG